jgi:hypothetical protein
MEVVALPGFIPNSKLELFEAALQSFPFTAFSVGRCIVPYELAQIFSNQARQRCIAVHGYLADPFHQVLWQGKRDIHIPMRRESLIPCNLYLQDSRLSDPFTPTLWSLCSPCPLCKIRAFSVLRRKTPRATVSE